MKIFFLLVLFGLTSLCLQGQNDSILLPEINIFASFNDLSKNSAFIFQHKADSNALGLPVSLSELLQNDGIYFKNYSSSGLSTIGNRGFGASQTRLYWNGFLLNSPLNGTIDLNLLNIDPTNTNVTFVKSTMPVEGGQSGAGGSIWIEPDYKTGKGNVGSLSISGGSFNTFKGSVSYRFGNSRFSSLIQTGFNSSDNNYKYQSVLEHSRPEIRMKDAGLRQWFVSNSFKYRFDKANLTLNVFVNDNNRGIPPPITSSASAAIQKDKSLRVGLGWDRSLGSNSNIAFNAGYLRDDLLYYFDKNFEGHASYYVSSMPLALKGQTSVLDHEIRLNVSHILYVIESSELEVPVEQHSLGTLEVNSNGRKPLMYGISLQKMITTAYNPPLNYRLYLGGRLKNGFKSSLSYATTNQLPGLNDRFWPLSGNPDLKVETSKSWELNMSYHKNFESGYSLTLASSFFVISVDNWIVWIPVGGDFWRPFNVRKVESKGLDLNINQSLKISTAIKLSAIYNLNIADPVIKKIYAGSPAIEGKRLIYVPVNQQALTVKVENARHSIYTTCRFIGSRFTTSDNDETNKLPSYSLLDLGHQFRFNLFRLPFQSRIQLNNILNTSYENIAYRPLPGRNFEVALGFKF